MSEKIQPVHRERSAVVYVRQSTMDQVRHNRESQARQYGLADRARQLGFARVEVIDDDLGKSGSGLDVRVGFARLVAWVCEGRVGAVLVVEASRLARNGRDWHHLIDLCALSDALVIDHDGVYDARLLNDRLLLGLKGAMAEFELGLLRQRSREALRAMIGRGEVLWEPPVGYTRSRDNRLEMTPDLQVQQAVRSVFEKFRECGSARQVLLWFRQERLPLPSTEPGSAGQAVKWRLPGYGRIISILENPAYAGSFVWGRRATRTTVIEGRAHSTQGHFLPRDEWKVLLHDHHAGYISWAEYLANQEQLGGNCGMKGLMGHGAAKSGHALLAGLLRCARCGRKFHVAYSGASGEVPRYHCRGAQINHGEAWCISFGGLRCDQAVEAEVLAALRPEGVAASLLAWEELNGQENQKRAALRLAVEKAQYQAEYARRQYDAVDPDNRLVAAELEKRWNQAMEAVAEAESRLAQCAAEQESVTGDERSRLMQLGGDVEGLWSHPAAGPQLKKRILRTVLNEIVADVSADGREIVLRLHWVGGVHTVLRVPKNATGRHQHCTDMEVVDLVRRLAVLCSDAGVARVLNMSGYRTGQGNTWTELRVRSLRSYRDIPAHDPAAPRNWVTLDEAATALSVSTSVVRKLLLSGVLPASQIIRNSPWMIPRENLTLPGVRAAVENVRRRGRGSLTDVTQPLLPVFSPT